MKKLLFITLAISILSFTSFAEDTLDSSLMENAFTTQQTTTWELLGDVTGVSADGTKCSGKLYIKVIGNKDFYKVRVEDKDYSVSHGKYVINNHQYNAKFTVDYIVATRTYYLDI